MSTAPASKKQKTSDTADISPISSRLAGRVAIVTGGASGIGRSIALRLSREGASVLISDINEAVGAATVETISAAGGTACFCKTDCMHEADIEACVAKCKDQFGRLDILINNAVYFAFGHLGGAGNGSKTGTDRDIPDTDWEKVWTINVLGYARFIKHSVPLMRLNELTSNVFQNEQGEGVTTINAGSRGSIVNVASVSSYIAQPEFVPYNASKGAVLQLTKCNAMDLAPSKIRVNAVCPGTIETQGSYGHMRALGLPLEEGRKVFGDSCLLKRQAAPEEIAAGVAFLASDDASFMTGAHMVMDGGGTI